MKKVYFAFIATLLAGITGIARADTVTYSGSSSGATDVTNQLISVNQFNPALGTLLSATFELSAAMNSSAYAANDGNFYVGWDKLQFSLSLIGDAPYSSIAIGAGNAPQRVVGSGSPDGTSSFAEMQNIMTGVNPSMWTHAMPTLSAAQTFAEGALASFVGTGNLGFFLNTLNYDALSVAGAQSAGMPASSQGLQSSIFSTVSVTYAFAAPVPEPGTYALMIAGLVLITIAVRRGAGK